jgi:tetratricopeptide (TPR) repeat protein
MVTQREDRLYKQARRDRLPLMKKAVAWIALSFTSAVSSSGQIPANDTNFKLALPAHKGQLLWHASGYKVVQSSAKPGGQEIGIRGRDDVRKITFLGFLFIVAGQSSLTGTKCKDGAMEDLKKSNSTLKILAKSEVASSNNLPVEIVTYTAKGRGDKMVYSTRGFVAISDICGDLELYSESPINPEDPEVHKIFQSYHFDTGYDPQFNDVFLYGQILYRDRMYKAAAPIFELSLTKLKDKKGQEMMRRVATDQAGMAYGISGDTSKARSVFESAIVKDPDYPMYYYNLACADAQEKKLAVARIHLEQAFARKANTLPGEALPDPSKDDSFTPYRNDKDFWKFIESLN